MGTIRRTVLKVAVAIPALLSCMNPVHSDEVDALGGNPPGQRNGPEHRPGQPCLVCHGQYGPASAEFSVAGTVFATRAIATGQAGVSVLVTDAANQARTFQTNRAGNFYVPKSAWDPSFPLHVVIDPGDGTAKTNMETFVNGEGSCNKCHQGDGDRDHSPRIYARLK